jgi:hypothetical protein
MATSGQVVVVAVQDKVFPVQFTFAGTASAGTIATGTIYPYGFNNPSTSTSYQIPAGSKYQLVDMYVSASPAVDAQLIFNLNGIPQGENLILSTMISSNSGRAKLTQPLVLNASDVFNVQVVTLAVSTYTVASTDTLFLHFLQVPA